VKLTIGRKIFAGFLILIVLSAAFLLLSFPSLSEINILSSRVVPLSQEIGVLQEYTNQAKQLESKIELFFTIRSKESQEEVIRAVSDLNKMVFQSVDAQDSRALAEASQVLRKLTSATYTLMGYMEDKASSYDINMGIIKVNELFSEFQRLQKELQRRNLEILKLNVERQEKIINTLLDMFLVVEISIVFFGFIASFVLTKAITRSLSKLSKGTRDISSGNFEAKIDISSKDEIGDLAASFNLMAENLLKTTVSKQYVDNIISNMAETLLVVDHQLIIKQANGAAYSLLGYQEGELLGKGLSDILSFDDENQAEGLLRSVKEGSLNNLEICFRGKQGEVIPILFSAAAIKDDNGEVVYAVCTAWDITERKLAEQKIAEVSSMKSKLTSMVSHELRTPMAAIKSGITIVLDRLAGEVNDEQEEILNLARRNVDRLARLVNDVLDFQKLEAGKMTFSFQDNDLNSIVKDSCDSLCLLIKQKGLNFKVELADSPLLVSCDRDKMNQVVVNLLNNAIKFTDCGGISVKTKAEGNKATVIVSDTGIGLKDEDKERVFYSFEQIKRYGGGGPGGTGLGLAICKEIIERHNGRIWVESQFGRGSEFCFSLPAA
jgi:PAS domain S-box-containing protein